MRTEPRIPTLPGLCARADLDPGTFLAGGGGALVLVALLALLCGLLAGRLLARRQAARLGAELEETRRSKARLFAGASDELRTPLNAVVGLAQILSDTRLDREQRGYVEDLERSAEWLAGVIDGYLAPGRKSDETALISHTDFDLRALVRELEGEVAPRAREAGLDFEVTTAGGLDARLVGDRGRLRKTLRNLLDNALRYTPAGLVHLHVELHERAGEDLLEARVTDSGIGIAEDQRAKLFTPFARGGASGGGMGLGLALCERWVHEMDGTLGCDSQPGRGSTFWVRVPVARAPRIAAERRSEPGREPAARNHP